MDATDIKIMNILQQDARTTTREIGRQVGLTAPAVSERVARLRERGAILGFEARLDPAAVGLALCAFVQMNVPPDRYDDFCAYTLQCPAITEHHHIIGPNNALLRVRVPDAAALEEELKKLRAFGLSQTAVVLHSYFEKKPLEAAAQSARKRP